MNIPVLRGYRPVRREARYGVQTGQTETAFSKLTLREARESRKGVLTLGSPPYPVAWARHWSVSTKTTFGLSAPSRIPFPGVHPETVRVRAAPAHRLRSTKSRLEIFSWLTITPSRIGGEE
jgi:hypothetical protein